MREPGYSTPRSLLTETVPSGTEYEASQNPQPRRDSIFKSIGSRGLSYESGNFQYNHCFNPGQWRKPKWTTKLNESFNIPRRNTSQKQSVESEENLVKTDKKR